MSENQSKDELAKREAIRDAMDAAIKQQKALNSLMNEKAILMGNYTEAMGEALNMQKSIGEELKRIMLDTDMGIEKQREKMGEILGLNTEFNTLLSDMLARKKEGLEIEAEQLAILKEQINGNSKLVGLSSKYTDAIAEAVANFDGSASSAGDVAKAIQNAEEAMDNLKNAQKEASKVAGKFASNFGLAADFGGTIVGQMSSVAFSLAKAYDAAGPKGLLMAMGGVLNDALSLERVFASIVEQAFKFAQELDKASKAFGSATAFDISVEPGVQQSILDVSKNLLKSGVTITDTSTALKEFSDNVNSFDLTEINHQTLQTIAVMKKAGISVADVGGVIDSLEKSMAMTAQESTEFSRRIVKLGQAINVSGTKMMNQFKSSMDDLIEFGPQMEDTFKNLALQAKMTGISMSKLIEIGKKFDTFEGANKQVSQLNAVLGTQLSSMEMLNMSHDERINKIRSEVKASVGNFNTLDRYTKKYIAQAMGVESVEKAQRLLNMSEAEYFDNQKKRDKAMETQRELEDITSDLVPMFDKLKIAFMELVRQNEGLILFFVELVEGMAEMSESGFLQGLIMFLGAASIALMVFGAAAGHSSAQIKLLQFGLMLLFLAYTSDSWGYFALALGMIGAGLFFMAKGAKEASTETKKVTLGMQLLHSIFGKRINPLFVNAFAHMGMGVKIFAKALRSLNGPAATGALVLMGLGISFALVIYSLTALLDGIGRLFVIFRDNLAVLPQIALGFYQVALAIGSLGIAAILSLTGLLLFFGAFGAISAVIAGVGVLGGAMALSSLGESMESIGNGMEKFANGLSKVKQISESMKSVGEKAFMAFSSDGSNSTAIISSTDIIKNMSFGKMKIDVNMPEMKMPEIVVNVHLDGTLIKQELHKGLLGD